MYSSAKSIETSLVMTDIFTLITPDGKHATGHLVGLNGHHLLLYAGLGPFSALKVQSKLVCLGGGVCYLKTVNKNVNKVILLISGDNFF